MALLAVLLAVAGCVHTTPPPRRAADGIVRHFVVVFAATDWGEQGREADDPSSRNAVWLQTSRLATAAQSWQPLQLTVLYQDGTAPSDEPPSALPLLPATTANLRRVLRQAAAQMDSDDHLLLHLSLHGEPSGMLHCDNGDLLSPRQLDAMLAAIPADRTMLIVDACFAGAAILPLKSPVTRIGTAPAGQYGWIERDFSFGQFFFQQCTEPANPVAVRQAFAAASSAFRAAGEARLPGLRTTYSGEGLDPDYLEDLSFDAILITPPTAQPLP